MLRMAATLPSIVSSSFVTARVVPLLAAALLTPMAAARADGSVTTSCVGIRGAATCTTIWRRGLGDSFEPALWTPRAQLDAAASAARERLWLARCRPVAEFDRYGVKRYRYAAVGCEFGRHE
jgi:hypothetical protein